MTFGGGGNVIFLLARYVFAISDHISPENIRNSKGQNDPPIEEICIPPELSNFTWDMGSLSSIFLPDQDMANAISLEIARAPIEIARAGNTVPSYHPYVVPSLDEDPWVALPPIIRARLPVGAKIPGIRDVETDRKSDGDDGLPISFVTSSPHICAKLATISAELRRNSITYLFASICR